MQEFNLEDLRTRALSLLLNPELISDSMLSWAYTESLEFCAGRKAPIYALYDFALMRLKRLLKMPFSDEDALIYENARKAIERAPLIEAPAQRFVRTRDFGL
ncbi:hypothetical protein [Helicobacter cynogastricus]|uniref:OMP200 n=1 Tax=Helicobacter cynogastricus TaxID=329937 RepID=A0A1R3UDY1_9HELI|nr:hypothetical protein [Helicobacter cynogastricus]SFZ72191.1 OMP200 [Helicobacter cynogastricus]